MGVLEPAVEFVIRFELTGRLLAHHIPDGQGRCRACTAPGYGTPMERWPCTVTAIATKAADATGTG